MEILKKELNSRSLRVGVTLFDGYELLDTYGPLELFFSISIGKRKLSLIYLSPEGKPVSASGGTQVKADVSILNDEIPPLDILFVPGGSGTRALQKDNAFMEKFTKLAVEATLVVTVCTGSMLLAKTGVLDGVEATTNKLSFKEVAAAHPNVLWQESARWVTSGKFYTSAGVSAGLDVAYQMLCDLYGEKYAEKAAVAAEYVPNRDAAHDPFAERIHQGEAILETCKELATLGDGVLKVAVVIYENFEMLDTFGPLEMLTMANKILSHVEGNGVDFELVGEDKLVKSAGGPFFLAKTFDEIDINAYDMVLLPGGIGTLRELYNPKMIKILQGLGDNCETIMTVCTGSTLFAQTGYLDNRDATSNKLAFNLLASFGPKVNWVKTARWIEDDKYFTSSGVSAGMDLALRILEIKFSSKFAAEVAALAEYEWNQDPQNDPFVHTIPKRTMAHNIGVVVQNSAVKAIFKTGFALGFTMKGITTKLISAI